MVDPRTQSPAAKDAAQAEKTTGVDATLATVTGNGR